MTKRYSNDYTAMLREFLSEFFRERGLEAYYFEAIDTALYPYIVYEIRRIDTLEDSFTSGKYSFEINAYTEYERIELDNLLDFLEKELNFYSYTCDSYSVDTKLAFGRIDIMEEKPIKRKRILFELNFQYFSERV